MDGLVYRLYVTAVLLGVSYCVPARRIL